MMCYVSLIVCIVMGGSFVVLSTWPRVMTIHLLCVSALLPVHLLQFPGTVKGQAGQQIKV